MLKAFVDSGAQCTISKFIFFYFPSFFFFSFPRTNSFTLFYYSSEPPGCRGLRVGFFSILSNISKSISQKKIHGHFFFQSNASFGYEICRCCKRCRHCQDARKSTWCTTQACRFVPTLSIHRHAGPTCCEYSFFF